MTSQRRDDTFADEDTSGISIRDYDNRRDRERLIELVGALQDFERDLEPHLPTGRRVAQGYVQAMLQRCAAYRGRILVADGRGGPAGFLCVLGRIPPAPADDQNGPHAVVGELYLDPSVRGSGVGRMLLEHAEAHARERGALRLRVQVLAGNAPARALYQGFGFRERLVEMEKDLQAPAEP